MEARPDEPRTEPRSALLVGATGLVGSHCLTRLLAEPAYERVTVLSRRPLGREHERLSEHLVNFERLEEHTDWVRGDDLYCCLGTTIKQAGSQAAFRHVDHDLVLNVARLAQENGARRLALVSSVGAAPEARNFYLRTKGETERDVAGLGYDCLEVFRPSFLVGEREAPRLGERLGIGLTSTIARAFVGPLRRFRPIEADQVAAAMVAALRRGEPGVRLRTHAEIVQLAALAAA